MKKIILWIWQFPQNILGFLMIKIMRAKHNGIFFKCPLFHSGVSLGNYMIFDYRIYVELNDYRHECGHQKQSLYLGWFYLPLIGLPSMMRNILHRFINFDYYSLPWEKWADKLGKVDRRRNSHFIFSSKKVIMKI